MSSALTKSRLYISGPSKVVGRIVRFASTSRVGTDEERSGGAGPTGGKSVDMREVWGEISGIVKRDSEVAKLRWQYY
jgi:hypothetical protein